MTLSGGSFWRAGASVGYPLSDPCKAGQPHPFDRYPLVALGVAILAALYGTWL